MSSRVNVYYGPINPLVLVKCFSKLFVFQNLFFSKNLIFCFAWLQHAAFWYFYQVCKHLYKILQNSLILINILLIMENATPRNSEYFLMKLGTVIRCSLKIK
jgi:hypothetical protein